MPEYSLLYSFWLHAALNQGGLPMLPGHCEPDLAKSQDGESRMLNTVPTLSVPVSFELK